MTWNIHMNEVSKKISRNIGMPDKIFQLQKRAVRAISGANSYIVHIICFMNKVSYRTAFQVL